MSAPSSDGRPSFSSEPSARSSRTFASSSKTPPTHVGYGEGGSSPRQRSSRDASAVSQGSGSSPLGADAIDEHDFAHRRPRAGRSGGGGFLLDPGFPGPRHSARHVKTPDSKGKSRRTTSPGSSPPAEADHHGRLRMPKARSSVPPPAVDPNQLVHMALNLSESRRRNISASQLLGSQSRAPSAAQREGSFSNAGVGSSLRQYLNEQRRVSRNMSPMGGRGSPSRHMSTGMQRSASMALPTSQAANPSLATLVRRDKARAYIELRAEYMRLLELLPPLKADAHAPGNFIYSSNAVPGSPTAQLTRTPSYANKQHDLGRPYNPIQALRNRRSRARERLALPHEPAHFADIDQVHDWVDQVAEQSGKPGYRREDGVELPALHTDHETQAQQAKPPKSHQGWSFTPEELLADAYWLEHGDNKTTIEDRNGRKIFARREPPKPQKHDFLSPRPSNEYADKRRRSWVDGLPGTADNTADESEHGSERGRKRRLLPTIRADSRLRKGRGSPRKHSVGYSESSDSDIDARRTRKSFDAEHNTGPLALQMKKKLELQTKGIDSKAAATFTPDTPDKWGKALDDVPDGKVSRNSLEVPRFVSSAARIDQNAALKMPPRNRTNPLSPIKSAEPRSSIEEDSTAPSTPLYAKHFPHMGSDLSPPPSRAGSDLGKAKRSKLNIFHSSHDHDGKHEHETAGLDKKQGSRQTSEEHQESSSRGTAIFAAPGAVKNLLSHRKGDSVSSLPSPDKLRRRETQDAKEPHSAVTRFFKGVKHEGTKVGDIIFRRDRADDTDASTVSDRNSVEFDDDRRPTLSRTVTSTTAGSATSEKDAGYHLQLPSFRPAHAALSDTDDASDPEHHISRQSRERRTARSPRIDRLLPPRMDLERVSSASSAATLGPVRSRDQDHVHKQLARPGSVFPGVPPPTGLKNAQNRHRSTSRPTLDGKRQWSIADGDDEQQREKRQNVATQADIARVRALFLCSGVKAKEIARRAQTPSSQAPHFLTLAAETAKEQLFPVPRKEEHVLAARILVHDLERSTSALHAACEQFRSGTIKDLNTRITHLRDSIESDLMPRILESGDKAVHITSEVSGQGPLQVKQINDEIDRMLRQRRRHTRWIMSWGWSAVEWTIVVALRFASILFALYGLLKGAVGMVWGVVRWLLWL
ncbi:uncharacterized protein EKO05_0004289 [Ascochyta rabiei]|uniref:Uncharacterized protein n=1 Tax=Didymella rabiei TaxID=5454 RepID=A0A162Y9K1_DIDRA|nr:uncharacterized protein EKO05_0004289 [Ascochyta rabiei]KZM19899.1 hypothetical protein ST47_g9036 [Ascochyta rabiei]UPX13790.1 hypothetical protein EKO05_0004289 [Ascochyta rabiei]